MDYTDDIIETYDQLVNEAIPDFLAIAQQCDIGVCELYFSAMPEEKAVVTHVEVTTIDQSQIWTALSDALKPHYRSDDHPFTPRLNGQIQLHGIYQDKAMKAALKINELKTRFGDLLKDQYPKMHTRVAYLRKNFDNLAAKSVHRQLIIGDQQVQKSSLHWSENNPKSIIVEYEDIRNILSYSCDSNKVDALLKAVDSRMSHDSTYRFIHILNVRVHPVHVVKTAQDTSYKRQSHRAGLPLLIFGNQSLPSCEFGHYTFGMERKRQNNKPKHRYFEILPEFGLYQRKLTSQELTKLRSASV